MKKLLLLSLFCFLSVGLFAQTTVSGKVSAAADGAALPGVTVLVKGTSTGTQTDMDGNYTLTVGEGADVLVFSFIGLQTQEIAVGGRTTINVSMAENATELQEVVVTALGISRDERSLGYAVQKVGGESLQEVKDNNNVINSLNGKVAGVQIKGASGNMGGSANVLIRGVSSITGNNQPLFVVDGTPISNNSFADGNQAIGVGGRDYGNAAGDLNPDDIESITVLKGASASALYGSRAANGVIMVTTKKGSKKKGLGIEVNSNVTFDKVYILPDYQNQYGGGYSQTFDTFTFDPAKHPASWASFNGQKIVDYGADESWGPKLDGTPVRHWDSWFAGPGFGELRPFSANPDNVRDFFNTGITSNNSIAFNGGSENGSFRLSYTNMTQEGVVPNSSRQKNTFSFNGSQNLSKKLTASISVNYINQYAKGRPMTGYDFATGRNVMSSFNQWFQRQIDVNRLKNYSTPEGLAKSWNIRAPDNANPAYWDNPYWVTNKNYTEDWRGRVYGNVGLSYAVNENLKLSAIARTDFYTFRVQDRIASGSLAQAYFSEDVQQEVENNFEFLAQFNKDLNDELSLSVNAGANLRYNQYQRNYGSTVGGLNVPNFFNLGASIGRPDITDYFSEKQVNSVYATASLSYKDMLYVDGSIRNDWFSTLQAGNNTVLYPAVSTSFVFTELLGIDAISFGKVRANWGRTGNDTDPYRLANNYSIGTPYGNSPAFFTPNTINNPALKPETTTEIEFGLDLRFLNGRVGFDAAYYNRQTSDQILPVSISGATGYTSAYINAGLMKNSGVELTLNATPVKTGAFSWDVNFNWAKNMNEVVELTEGLDNVLIGSYGPSVNAKVGYPYGTFVTDGYQYFQAKDAEGNNIDHPGNGKPVIASNGLYARQTNKIYGSYMPNWTGGITNSVSYKGFRVSALIDFQDGGLIYSLSNRFGTYSGLLGTTVGNNDKGNPIRDDENNGGGIRLDGVDASGNDKTVYANAHNHFQSLNSRRGDSFLYDASYVKFRELSVSYTLSKDILSKTPFTAATVSFVGRNLWLMYRNAPNIDPEATLAASNIQGFEMSQIPSTRSLGFNISLKF